MFPFTPKERESITSVVELPKPQQKKFNKTLANGAWLWQKNKLEKQDFFSFPNYQAVKKV